MSIIIIGIVFKLQLWPMAGPMIFIGMIMSLVIVVVSAVKNPKISSLFYNRLFRRSFLMVSIALLLFFKVHTTTYIRILYRDQPAYRDAYLNLAADPDNEELQKKEEEERYKMQEKRSH